MPDAAVTALPGAPFATLGRHVVSLLLAGVVLLKPGVPPREAAHGLREDRVAAFLRWHWRRLSMVTTLAATMLLAALSIVPVLHLYRRRLAETRPAALSDDFAARPA